MNPSHKASDANAVGRNIEKYNTHEVPWLPRMLVGLSAPRGCEKEATDDLVELYHTYAVKQFGVARAEYWTYFQAIRSAGFGLLSVLGRLAREVVRRTK